jgi:hypothetical protein
VKILSIACPGDTHIFCPRLSGAKSTTVSKLKRSNLSNPPIVAVVPVPDGKLSSFWIF